MRRCPSKKMELFLIALGLTVVAVIFLAGCNAAGKATNERSAAGRVSGTGQTGQIKCVCHSKDQAILSMHRVLGMRDCSQCHSENEDLMAKGGKKTAEQKAATQARKRSEPVCLECHQAGGEVKAEKTRVSGNWFCPTCQKKYSQSEAVKKGSTVYCPVDGEKLLNIDEIMKQSTKQPSNRLCVACHPISSTLKGKHAPVLAASGKKLDNCLVCHESHTKCGNCHF